MAAWFGYNLFGGGITHAGIASASELRGAVQYVSILLSYMLQYIGLNTNVLERREKRAGGGSFARF
jgi:hypothetical protein